MLIAENGNNGEHDKMLCNICDFEELQRLASVMLQALAASSLQAGITTLTDLKVNQLKNKMMDVILSHGTTSCYPEGLVIALQKFVGSAQSGWSSSSSSALDNLVPRLRELDDTHYFPMEERLHLAQMIVRSLDHNGHYHCLKLQSECSGGAYDTVKPATNDEQDAVDSSATADEKVNDGSFVSATLRPRCDFYVIQCHHDGCMASFSYIRRQRHNNSCEYKRVACLRECGDEVPRREMNAHMDKACRLRPAKCVFYDLGCNTGEYILYCVQYQHHHTICTCVCV